MGNHKELVIVFLLVIAAFLFAINPDSDQPTLDVTGQIAGGPGGGQGTGCEYEDSGMREVKETCVVEFDPKTLITDEEVEQCAEQVETKCESSLLRGIGIEEMLCNFWCDYESDMKDSMCLPSFTGTPNAPCYSHQCQILYTWDGGSTTHHCTPHAPSTPPDSCDRRWERMWQKMNPHITVTSKTLTCYANEKYTYSCQCLMF